MNTDVYPCLYFSLSVKLLLFDAHQISILASAMGPYREYTYLNNKKKETPITSFIIGESVKVMIMLLFNFNVFQLSTKDCTEIYTILKHSDPMKLFVHSDLKTLSRKDVGMYSLILPQGGCMLT